MVVKLAVMRDRRKVLTARSVFAAVRVVDDWDPVFAPWFTGPRFMVFSPWILRGGPSVVPLRSRRSD